MAVKRYSKKSLKQPDEFITFSSRLVQQVIQHKNKIIAALSAIVVLVAIVSVINYVSQKKENRSLLMLSNIMNRYESIQKESGDVEAYNAVKDDLAQLVETYGKKSGGKFGNFFLANCCFAAGNFESSAAHYRKAVADFKGVFPFEILAKSSLGYALAQQGDHQAAASVFEEMSAGGAPIMQDELLFALARQYAAMGKDDLQKETARKLIETYPQSLYTNVVKEKFPDLVTQPAS